MISITLDFDTIDDASAALAAVNAIKKAKAPAPAPAPAPAKAEVKVSAGAAKAPAEPSAPPSEPAAAAPAPAALTYEAVHAAITQAVAGGRKTQVVDTLAKFGAKRGPELKPEQWADFLKGLQS